MATIILGTDLSDDARAAAEWAFGLAELLEHSTDDEVRLIVARAITERDLELRRVVSDHGERRERQKMRDEIVDWLEDTDTRGVDSGDGVDVDVMIRVGRPADALSSLAENTDADWLVVGKSGRGRLARLFVGSTAEHLALCPPCPLVLIHPDGFRWDEPLELLSAIDLGESSVRAAGLGARLVEAHGGHLTLLHVIELPHGSSPLVEGAHAIPETLETHLAESIGWAHDELDAMLEGHPVSFSKLSPTIEVRPGYPIHEVLNTADQVDANMLTLGCHSRSRFAEWMLGGIGRSVVKKSTCSVLIAPPK